MEDCKKSADTLRELANTIISIQRDNAAQTQKYKEALDNYNLVDYPNYLGRLREWTTKRNQAEYNFKSETRQWKNCVDGINCNNKGLSDSWCRGDIGHGWEFSGCEVSNCGAYRRGNCIRTNDQVNTELDNWVTNNPGPISPVQPQEKDYPLQPYPPMPSVNLNCCQNLATVISSQLTDSNLAQISECVNSIDKQSTSTSTSSQVTTSQEQQTMYNTTVTSVDPKMVYLGVFTAVLGIYLISKI